MQLKNCLDGKALKWINYMYGDDYYKKALDQLDSIYLFGIAEKAFHKMLAAPKMKKTVESLSAGLKVLNQFNETMEALKIDGDQLSDNFINV